MTPVAHDGRGDAELEQGVSLIDGHQPQSYPRKSSGSVQSVERAILLLELLAASGGGAALTEIARQTGLNISTCHHLLATLMRAGYVTQLPNRRTYALGARVLHLGQAFLRQVDVPRRAQPVLTRTLCRDRRDRPHGGAAGRQGRHRRT